MDSWIGAVSSLGFSNPSLHILAKLVLLSFLLYFCSENEYRSCNLVDKINIFRPDRVFMVITVRCSFGVSSV